MTPKQLDKLLKKWQQRLRIQDWDIDVKILNPAQMTVDVGKEVLGACKPDQWKKKADIVILDKKYLKPSEDDQETILVHELLHVVMNPDDLKLPLQDENPIHVAYERIVDQLARVLVGVFRNGG